MWLAWGIMTLAVASGAAQDSSPPQAEPSHDSSVTVRDSLRSGSHLYNSSVMTDIPYRPQLCALGFSYFLQGNEASCLFHSFHANPASCRCVDWHITLTLFYVLLSSKLMAYRGVTLQGAPSEADSANEG